MDLVKRKRQTTEENAARVNANTVLMNDTEVEDEVPNSHYTRTHWAHATTETTVRIDNIKEPVLALIDHGSEINLMSKEFFWKGSGLFTLTMDGRSGQPLKQRKIYLRLVRM